MHGNCMPKLHPEVMSFFMQFLRDLNEFAMYRFLVRAKSVLEQSRTEIENWCQEISTLLPKMQAEQQEVSAALLLTCQFIAKAVDAEIEAYIAIKEDDGNLAWDCLVRSERLFERAIEIYPLASVEVQFVSDLEKNLDRCKRLMSDLFPTPIYMSAGYEVRKASCSICKGDYDACEHEKGKVYMGEPCVRIIEEAELYETSILMDSEPANKSARVINRGKLDFMTLLPRDEEAERPNGKAPEIAETD